MVRQSVFIRIYLFLSFTMSMTFYSGLGVKYRLKHPKKDTA